MPRLIDTDALKFPNIAIFDMKLHGVTVPMVRLINLQMLMPTVDAVPVTRCGDCKWYETELHCKLNGFGCGRYPDWFCADGKKEEEDTEDGN